MARPLPLLLTLCLVACGGPEGLPEPEAQPPLGEQAAEAVAVGGGLKALAATHGITFGGVAKRSALDSDAPFRATLTREFNLVTPENELKMKFIQPNRRDEFLWSDADTLVNYARTHGLALHGHTLVWYKVPTWVDSTALGEREAVMKTFITTVATRYKGKVWAWDVVNEAFNDDGSYRNSVWYQAMGTGFVDKAFWTARTADPGAKLVYNDYGIETINAKSDAVYAMIKGLLAKGVPFDGLAFQMHIKQKGLNYASFADNMRRFAALGIQLYVSEMDVATDSHPATAADLAAQADVYWNILDRVLQQPAVKAFQLWGVTDKYTWLPDNDPLLFDASYQAKPAYAALEHRLSTGGFSGRYTLVNKRTGKALHVAGSAQTPAAAVVQYDVNEGWAAQQWSFNYVGGRAYQMLNHHSGLAMKVKDGSTQEGAVLEQYTPDTAMDSSQWEFIYAGNGYHALRNKRSQRLMVAFPGENNTPVQQYSPYVPTAEFTDSQLWTLRRVP
jgi:endo-1,4-beta-xylanase